MKKILFLLSFSSCLKLKASFSLEQQRRITLKESDDFLPALGCSSNSNMLIEQRDRKHAVLCREISSKLMQTSSNSEQSTISSSSPLPFEKEMGISRAFKNQFFDPLNIATEEYFPRFREAELKHGRIAMLATVGMFFPDVFRNPLMQGVIIMLPSNQGAKLTRLEIGLQNIEFSPVAKIKFGDIPNGLSAIGKIPLGVWAQILIAVGILELFFWKQRSPKSLPGDYGTGFFGIHDYGQHESLLESEIEIGRLAMIGFILQVLWELLTHTTVGQPYRDFLYP